MHNEREPKPQPLTLEEVIRVAKENLIQYGNHVPTVIADGSNQPVIIQIQDIADTHEGRLQQMFTVGFIVAQSGEVGELEQVFLITEAWMSSAGPDDLPLIRPSQDPQRKEILLVSSINVPARKQRSAVVEMVRDQAGNIEALRDHPFGEEEEGENKLFTAFVAGFAAASKAKYN
jgi:hypothetical protein